MESKTKRRPVTAGARLRRLREDLALTMRDVVKRSDLLSRREKNNRFAISLSVLSAGPALVIGIAVLIPLMYPDVLPTRELVTFLVAPPPPPPPPPPPLPAAKVAKLVSRIANPRLISPTRIPTRVQMIKEDEAPAINTAGVLGGVPGGVSGGQVGGVIGGILGSVPRAIPIIKPAPVPPKRLRVSQGISEGMLLQRNKPEYPVVAKLGRVQGTVVLQAIIATDGSIQHLHVVSGHPILAPYAMQAVEQWRYKPFLLNGIPVEVDTTITVKFLSTHSRRLKIFSAR